MSTPLRAAAKATRHASRTSNRRLALQTILRAQPVSRADIARATGLTRATISELVAELLEDGLVVEDGQGQSSGGKPPTLLRLDAGARRIVAVDLSSRPFRGALLDLEGAVHHRMEADGAADLDAVEVLVDHLVAGSDAAVLGVGVGTPGVVDDGTILQAANLGWTDVPLARRLADRTALPVHVANDAHVSAIDEFGRHPTLENVVVVRAGAGIGAGIVLDGRPFRGDGQAAGEIGHVPVPGSDRPCTCGRRGCLETIANLSALLTEAGLDQGGSPTDQIERLLAAKAAPQLIADAGRALGTVLAMVVGVLDVHRVVVGGPLLALGEPFLAAVREAVEDSVLPAVAPHIRVEASSAGDDAVLAGAWALVMANELGVTRR